MKVTVSTVKYYDVEVDDKFLPLTEDFDNELADELYKQVQQLVPEGKIFPDEEYKSCSTEKVYITGVYDMYGDAMAEW